MANVPGDEGIFLVVRLPDFASQAGKSPMILYGVCTLRKGCKCVVFLPPHPKKTLYKLTITKTVTYSFIYDKFLKCILERWLVECGSVS